MTKKTKEPASPNRKLRLGGMALENGLLLNGPTHWAATIRNDDGELVTATALKPYFRTFDRVVGIRGLTRLVEAIAVLPAVRRSLPGVRFAFQQPKVGISAVVAARLASRIRRRRPTFLGDFEANIVALTPGLYGLVLGDVAHYHAVEHMVVAAYELDVEDAAHAAREHERCGSHLVAPMILTSMLGSALLRATAKIRRSENDRFARTVMPVATTAAAIELFAWCEAHPKSTLTKLLRKPGYALQHYLGTRVPTAEQLEVGKTAMAAILAAEGAK